MSRVFPELPVDPELWSGAWTAKSCAKQQFELAFQELKHWVAGGAVAPFDVFRTLLSAVGVTAKQGRGKSLLEVGCGVGHYASVLWHFAPKMSYTGVDFSAEMVRTVRTHYSSPMVAIQAAAEELPFPNESYDVVVLGSVIGCCNDWQAAVREAFRVSRKFVMVHRAALHENPEWPPIQNSVKTAYDVEMAERIIHRRELMNVLRACNSGVPISYSETWSPSNDGYQFSCISAKR